VKKKIKTERGRPFDLLKFQNGIGTIMYEHVSLFVLNIQTPQLLMERNELHSFTALK
jgi:hypothetical protein